MCDDILKDYAFRTCFNGFTPILWALWIFCLLKIPQEEHLLPYPTKKELRKKMQYTCRNENIFADFETPCRR